MNRLFLATLLALTAVACAQDRANPMVEWPIVGADWANSKYSALDDIDRSNVEQLEVVWEWRPDEEPIPEFKTRPGNFEATPVMVDGVLFLSTMYARAVALDAETGEELWAFDPESWRNGHHGGGPGGFKHRGLAVSGSGKDKRIYIGSRINLYALDANGNPVASFGDNGRVPLTEGFPHPVTHEMFDQTSPPLVFEDLVIVGSRIPDRVQRKYETPGAVQAFDANTGERRWIFYTIPQSADAFGAATWAAVPMLLSLACLLLIRRASKRSDEPPGRTRGLVRPALAQVVASPLVGVGDGGVDLVDPPDVILLVLPRLDPSDELGARHLPARPRVAKAFVPAGLVLRDHLDPLANHHRHLSRIARLVPGRRDPRLGRCFARRGADRSRLGAA